MKVLLVTVGGSDVPVVKAIEKTKPEYVYFICSDDTGTLKNGSWRVVENAVSDIKKSLVEQTGLKPGNYEIVKVNCDKVFDIYEIVSGIIECHIDKQDKVLVDYTGGTKSMSAGAVAAAMDYLECEITLVAGERVDLVRVREGYEKFQKVYGTNKRFVRRQVQLARCMFDKRDYAAALAVLEELSDSGMAESMHDKWLYLCRALVYWDNFEWDKVNLLRNYDSYEPVKPLLKQLGLIRSGLEWYKDWKGVTKHKCNYAPVFDLLRNAERRAAAGAYDDAMSRVYRAVEMYAQFSLKNNEPALNSSDLQLEHLPEHLRSKYEKWRAIDGKIKFGLETSYELLADIGHPVGQVWGSKESKGECKRVQEMMKKRNNSFLAHGIETLNKEVWEQVQSIVWEFIHKADAAMSLRVSFKDFDQLPNDLTKFTLE